MATDVEFFKCGYGRDWFSFHRKTEVPITKKKVAGNSLLEIFFYILQFKISEENGGSSKTFCNAVMDVFCSCFPEKRKQPYRLRKNYRQLGTVIYILKRKCRPFKKQLQFGYDRLLCVFHQKTKASSNIKLVQAFKKVI